MVRFKFLDDWLIAINNANLKLQSKALNTQLDKKKKKTKWFWQK